MTHWYCPDCNTTVQEKNKLRHQASMNHRSKARYTPPVSNPPRRSERLQECEICYESKNRHTFKKCTQCIHSWCAQCNRKMKQCPFCRKARQIPRAPRAPRVQPRNNTELFFSSPDSPTYISTEDAFAFVNVVLEIGSFLRELIVGR
ncbi:hypothetical protein EBU71_21475 [bacterium]|nr:hypothetical protein [Candidatus Elulimicrobium humile]